MSKPAPMPSYWALAEEVTHLHGRLDKLQDENAKLRAARDTWAENDARLRELVRTIYMCSSIRCNQCEYGHGNTCDFDAEAELRELGIELEP